MKTSKIILDSYSEKATVLQKTTVLRSQKRITFRLNFNSKLLDTRTAYCKFLKNVVLDNLFCCESGNQLLGYYRIVKNDLELKNLNNVDKLSLVIRSMPCKLQPRKSFEGVNGFILLGSRSEVESQIEPMVLSFVHKTLSHYNNFKDESPIEISPGVIEIEVEFIEKSDC